MQQLLMCFISIAVSCAFLQPTFCTADECVLYQKRASVKGVCGNVANIAREKLDNVEITLTDEGKTVLFNTKSDSNGSFSFPLIPEGSYTLHVKAPGYREARRDLHVSRSAHQGCKHKIEVTLGFRVCDTVTYIKGVDRPSDLEADFQK